MPNRFQAGGQPPQRLFEQQQMQYLLPEAGTPEGALQQRIQQQATSSREALEQARKRIQGQRRSNAEMAFGIAGAFGKPTRTGSFGETMSNVAGALQTESQSRRQFEQQKEADLMGITQQQSGLEERALKTEMDLMRLRQRKSSLQDVPGKAKGKSVSAGQQYKDLSAVSNAFEEMIYDDDFDGAVGWLDQFTGKIGAQRGTKEGLLTKEAEFASNSLILEAAGTLKGNLSDKDLKFLQKSQPSIGDSPYTWRRWYEKDFKPRVEAARQRAIEAGDITEDTQIFGQRETGVAAPTGRGIPQVGDIVDGEKYIGGNLRDKSSWKTVRQTRRGVR